MLQDAIGVRLRALHGMKLLGQYMRAVQVSGGYINVPQNSRLPDTHCWQAAFAECTLPGNKTLCAFWLLPPGPGGGTQKKHDPNHVSTR
jgi:hypothetical protein